MVDVVGVLVGQWWQLRVVQLAEVACEDFCRGGITDDVVEVEQQQARVRVLDDLHAEQGTRLEVERADEPGQVLPGRFGGGVTAGEAQWEIVPIDAGQALADLAVPCRERGAQRLVTFHQPRQRGTQPVAVQEAVQPSG